MPKSIKKSVDAFICYKQKCKVTSFNLGHPVWFTVCSSRLLECAVCGTVLSLYRLVKKRGKCGVVPFILDHLVFVLPRLQTHPSSKYVILGWRCSGLPVVMKFLKFHSCPEIVLKSAIVLKLYSFGQNVLIWTFVVLSLYFFYKSWLRLCCWHWVSSNVFSCDIVLFYV